MDEFPEKFWMAFDPTPPLDQSDEETWPDQKNNDKDKDREIDKDKEKDND